MGKRAVLLGAAIAAAILVVAGVRLASAGEDAGATTLLDRVAVKLGVEPDRLEQAFREARDEEIDERVQDGDLSQEQADRLKERLDEMPPEGGWAPFPEGRGPGPHPWMEKLHGAFGLGLGLIDGASALAEFLGVDESELMRELASGESLATIAEDNGKSRDELKAFILSEADVRIDEAVESGVIPQDRADELRSKLSEHVEDVIDGRLPEFKWDFRFHRGGGHDEPNPEMQQSYSSPGSSTRS